MHLRFISLLACVVVSVRAQMVVLTNDDGWATAQIRSQYNALKAAGFNVILSAPAQNESGQGSKTSTPTALNKTCEFNTCAVGSPAEGSDPNDPRLNYVNGFPVDSIRFGLQTLVPEFFGSGVKPDLVLSGTNIGTNTGNIGGSGTVGAACEAALEGVPSVAFSGASGSQVSFTTLNQTTATSTEAANVYTSLYMTFTNALLNNSKPLLAPGVSVNVNFASITNCPSAADYKFVFTRLVASSTATDVETCGTDHLTAESTALSMGCIATVSAFNASTKADVNAATQGAVLNKLTSILSCL